jgi:hypothetical protein
MEEFVEHMQRVTAGLAVEAAKRIVAANPESDEAVVRSIVQQILLDWFMGEFLPGRGNQPMAAIAEAAGMKESPHPFRGRQPRVASLRVLAEMSVPDRTICSHTQDLSLPPVLED